MALFLRMRKSRANARLLAFLLAVGMTSGILAVMPSVPAAMPGGKETADVPLPASVSGGKEIPTAAPKETTAAVPVPVGKEMPAAIIGGESLAHATAGEEVPAMPPILRATPAVTCAAPTIFRTGTAGTCAVPAETAARNGSAADGEGSGLFTTAGEAVSASLPAAGKRDVGLFPDYILRGKLRCDTENHPKGTVVQVLEGQSDCYYLVRSADGDRMAVAWDDLTLLPPPALTLPEVDTADIEAEVARRGFTSGTDCLLWTCLYRLETYLLCRRDGAWRLCGRMACSAGDTAHPTPTGRYAIATKLTTIGKPDRYLCRNALCFHGAYMYHSVLLSPAGDRVLDGRLGCRISHGCIRLSEEEAAALFETVPCGTAVYIN